MEAGKLKLTLPVLKLVVLDDVARFKGKLRGFTGPSSSSLLESQTVDDGGRNGANYGGLSRFLGKLSNILTFGGMNVTNCSIGSG